MPNNIDGLWIASQLQSNSTPAACNGLVQLARSNQDREGLQVVVDTAAGGPVYFLLGQGRPTSTNFHFALAPGGQWDGMISSTVWQGALQGYSTATPLAYVGVAEV